MLDELFKAKSIADGEWITGYLYRISESQNPFIMPPDSKGTSYEVDPSTVQRCTSEEYMDPENAEVKEMDKSNDYNVLFTELQKSCDIDNCCNAFANITLDELKELNYLLDRLLIFVESIGIDEFEYKDFECGDEVLNLYRLAGVLFSRDLS